MTTTPRKQHLIDTAFRLFNEHGYHATGIDWILSESGVSKATLYKHFPSKEALILAVLNQRHQQLLSTLDDWLANAPADEGVVSVFDVLGKWFNSRDFYGCNFIRASGEYSRRGDPIHQFASQHKCRVMQLLARHLEASSPPVSGELAEDLLLLMDGAIVAAHTRGDKQAATRAKNIARQLIASAS